MGVPLPGHSPDLQPAVAQHKGSGVTQPQLRPPQLSSDQPCTALASQGPHTFPTTFPQHSQAGTREAREIDGGSSKEYLANFLLKTHWRGGGEEEGKRRPGPDRSTWLHEMKAKTRLHHNPVNSTRKINVRGQEHYIFSLQRRN
ncbi:hypothetical protein EK904_006058 [Melospiza melodia maxima]|nr:hypothetical protein EK904_006058 [Melospiza melodia maxima]